MTIAPKKRRRTRKTKRMSLKLISNKRLSSIRKMSKSKRMMRMNLNPISKKRMELRPNRKERSKRGSS